MRIKTHPKGNQYLLSNQLWIRNFVTPVSPLDINQLSPKSDYSIFFQNEIANQRHNMNVLDFGNLRFTNAIIVSDGYKFKEKSSLLTLLPKNVAVIAINRSLFKWNVDKKIDFFLVNNPYAECMNFLPTHRYYPRCVASTRVYPQFVETYKERGGNVFSYSPTPDLKYSPPWKTGYLDDYRSPLCASIHLAYKLGVINLLLFCCDDSFDSERPASIKLENGLWCYPQHMISHSAVDGMLYWYKKIKNVKLGDHSSGPFYENASYIRQEEICKFFDQ